MAAKQQRPPFGAPGRPVYVAGAPRVRKMGASGDFRVSGTLLTRYEAEISGIFGKMAEDSPDSAEKANQEAKSACCNDF